MPLPWTDAADALESASLDTLAGMDLEIKRLLRTRHMLAAALVADGVEVPPFDQPGLKPSLRSTDVFVKMPNTLACKIARLLATGARRMKDIAAELGETDARVANVVRGHEWFVKSLPDQYAPWKLSPRGLESRGMWELPAEVAEAS